MSKWHHNSITHASTLAWGTFLLDFVFSHFYAGSTCLVNLFHLTRSCASSLVYPFHLGSPSMSSIRLHIGLIILEKLKDRGDCMRLFLQFLPAAPRRYRDNIIVVSCDNDLHDCTQFISLNIPVVSSEFILTGILRHEILTEPYPFLMLYISEHPHAHTHTHTPSYFISPQSH